MTFTLAPARRTPCAWLVLTLRLLGFHCRTYADHKPNRTRCTHKRGAWLHPRLAWRAALHLARLARCPIITGPRS